jgi:hypothetical protein
MEEFAVLKHVFGAEEKPAETTEPGPVAAVRPPEEENKWGVSPLLKPLKQYLAVPPVALDPVAETAFTKATIDEELLRRQLGLPLSPKTSLEIVGEDGRCEVFIFCGRTRVRLGASQSFSFDRRLEQRPSSSQGYATVDSIRLDGMRLNPEGLRWLYEALHHQLIATE